MGCKMEKKYYTFNLNAIGMMITHKKYQSAKNALQEMKSFYNDFSDIQKKAYDEHLKTIKQHMRGE